MAGNIDGRADFRMIDVGSQCVSDGNIIREAMIVKRAFHRQDGARVLLCDNRDF